MKKLDESEARASAVKRRISVTANKLSARNRVEINKQVQSIE